LCFEKIKYNIVSLQNRLKKANSTDHEIDRMVYALYELTEEEVGIAESEMKNNRKNLCTKK